MSSSIVCTSTGLGNPPKSFTTNNNESSNHLLKQKAITNKMSGLVLTNSFKICMNSNNMNVPRQSLVKKNLSWLTSTSIWKSLSQCGLECLQSNENSRLTK